jgi:uncharacterized membrane protein
MTMDRNSPLAAEPNLAADPELSPPVGAFNDARMEAVMGRLLQVGVLLAATVVLVGGVMYLFAHWGAQANYRVFRANQIELRHPMALLRGIVRGDASAIIAVGILLLVATPICRVMFAVIAFAIERDRLYVAISLTVLAVLLFGMLHAG